MSDPVSKVEDVEDVLSSIRRLVSDTSSDKRAASATSSELPANTLADQKPQEALVLTSALRINEPQKEPEKREAATKPTDLESLRKAVSGEYDHDVIADDVDESSSDAAQDDITVSWAKNPPEDYYEDEPDEAAVETLDLEADAAWVEDEPEAVFADSDDETGEAEEEDLAEETSFDEPADDAENEVSEAEDEVAEAEDEPQETAEIHQFEKALTEQEEAVEENEDDAETFEAANEEPEMLVEDDQSSDDSEDLSEEGSDEQVGADDVDTHDKVETVGIASFLRSAGASRDNESAGEDATEEEFDTATMFDADDEEDTPSIDLGDMDEAIIDEDMLRDLVAEIVRQELTGAMGERITRNVRKLVRREIHRALVAREFE